MAVKLTSAVEGQTPGETYEGPNEAWLLENGYAAAINPEDIPDLDHPQVEDDEYPDEEVDRKGLGHTGARYPEVAPETLVQNTRANEAVARARSTKAPYSSDPAPAVVPEPEPETEPDPDETEPESTEGGTEEPQEEPTP